MRGPEAGLQTPEQAWVGGQFLYKKHLGLQQPDSASPCPSASRTKDRAGKLQDNPVYSPPPSPTWVSVGT